MQPCVWTSERDGTDRVYLDQLAQVSELVYGHNRNGPKLASWKWGADPQFSHRALHQGRLVGIGLGDAWTGLLVAPERGDPWEFEADGLGALPVNYRAFAPTTGNVYAANEVVDDAIDRGLPLQRYDADADFTDVAADDDAINGSVTVADTLERVTKHGAQTWTVRGQRIMKLSASILNPTHMLYAATAGGGRTLDGLVSAVLVLYMDEDTAQVETTWVRSSLVEDRFGITLEDTLDLTDEAPMSAATAQDKGQKQIGTSLRALFGGSWTIGYGELTTYGGQPVDLASVQMPLSCQLVLTDPDRSSETDVGSSTRFVVDEFTYHADEDLADVTA